MNQTPGPQVSRAAKEEAPRETIELKVERVSQLFDTLDPFPFHERDLDPDAENFVVGWARELPRGRDIEIIVHLPKSEVESEHARDVPKAFAAYFHYRAQAVRGDLKELFRNGRFSLAVGLCVLAACFFAGDALTRAFPQSEAARFGNEGLIILGWVANWRPVEIFFYEWWPLVRRRRLYQRLAEAKVELEPR